MNWLTALVIAGIVGVAIVASSGGDEVPEKQRGATEVRESEPVSPIEDSTNGQSDPIADDPAPDDMPEEPTAAEGVPAVPTIAELSRAVQRSDDIHKALPLPLIHDLTYRDWATLFAHRLVVFDGRDIPDDFNYELLVRKLISWASGEEPPGQGAHNNPLNTTLRTKDSEAHDFNTAGVRNYSTLEGGVLADIDTLYGNDGLPHARFGYDKIVDALLDSNATVNDLGLAVTSSSWGTQHVPILSDEAFADYAATPIPQSESGR